MAIPRRRRKWLFISGAGILALSVLFLLPRKKPQTVYVAPARRMSELKAVVNGSGDIRTKDSVDIQAEIAGVIIDLPVREGDLVEKGQILLKIDPFQTESDVAGAQATLSALEADAKGQESQVATMEANVARDRLLKKSVEAELLQAEANRARTRELYGREKKLLEEKLISPDAFEITATQLKLNDAQVEVAEARVDQYDAQIKAALANVEYARATHAAVLKRVEGASSTLRRAKDLYEKTTIRSPLSGVIVKLNVEVGERAVPGIQSNPIATLMTIADLNIIEAELKVDETDIVNVKMQDVGKVLVDALPDTPLVGRVIEIGNSPISSATGSSGQEGKDFKVVLRIEDPPKTLRPGMSCEADITTAVRKGVLTIPIQALTAREVEVDAQGRYVPPRMDEPKATAGSVAAAAEISTENRKELQGVFLVGGDSKAKFRAVKTGILGEFDAEVLEGLQAGEEVVVGPLKALRTLEENADVFVDRSKPYRRLQKGRDKYLEEEEEKK